MALAKSLLNTGKTVSVIPKADGWDFFLRLTIIIGLCMVIFASIEGDIFTPLVGALTRHDWTTLLIRPSLLWIVMGVTLLVFRTVLWLRYRPFPSATMDDAPTLTVIIPAYNEGAMVGKTIDSLAAAEYPRDRLEIFVIDDGSSDDTWKYIQKAAAHHPGLITPLRFEKNRGKREALHTGFKQARGEIVITIDSDSVIEPATLLAMVGAFRNPKVGAVAGKVLVFNRREGIIPRMLHVRFILSFDFLRAAQSIYGTVYCTPGALSAYRTSVVRKVLYAWLTQRFLGVQVTYGEDRALTNFILEAGYDSVYQRSGVVHTIVPTTYSKLCKMYLRWDRSYVRKEIRFMRIVWKRPWKSMIIAGLDSIITNLRFPVAYLSIFLLIYLVFSDPDTLLRTLLAIGLMSLFYMLYYLRSERSLDMFYGVLYAYFAFFALTWVFPFALITLRSRSWMTR